MALHLSFHDAMLCICLVFVDWGFVSNVAREVKYELYLWRTLECKVPYSTTGILEYSSVVNAWHLHNCHSPIDVLLTIVRNARS